MGTGINCSNSEDKLGPKWIAIAVVSAILMFVFLAWAVNAPKKSITAAFNMCFRSIAAQDPDPKTRNPDYLAARIVNLDLMREYMGWTLDFESSVNSINHDKLWIFYYVTARTKHIDSVLLKELKSGVKQVVIMGAGYDTRAYRFYKDFPKVRFFEVDLPVMVADKKSRVESNLSDLPVNVVYAPINFNTQELGQVLAKVGYQKDRKTLFIWEGVVMYLDAAAVEGTLRFIAKNSAAGSSVVFDYMPPSVVEGTYTKDPYAIRMADFVRSQGEAFTFGIDPDESGAFLKKQGLKQVRNIGHDEMVKRYMTGSNGKPFGTVPNFFWITHARVLAK
ncbi:MAG: class I SAM-dependent methyltransferase [Deltaproteobacteria bacterium]|jgi:methyltransferase (TIGR00027 family)|nr:class I SAM-dependent methyltransferase [Deltaproteobacteria bacterium]